MTRFFLFLFSYGLCVMNISHLILYLNYRTLGYSWRVVFMFLLQTVEFYVALGAFIILIIVVFDLNPLRSPSS